MKVFTKESIERAIDKIKLSPDILKGRESKDYDLLLDNGNRYPPILVLSEAHKLLGGEALVVNDFNNSTKKPFKILKDLGYEVVFKQKNTSPMHLLKFDYRQFLMACDASGLLITDQLATRFISALITKPFVILSGLSGSGKTKLALAFSKWISSSTVTKKTTNELFNIGEEIKSINVTYQVLAADSIAVTLVQTETGVKVTLPVELIHEWIEYIKKNELTTETSARDIREGVKETTKYSSQLNSFEIHLKAAAFHLINKNLSSVEFTNSVCLIPVGADWTNREPLLGYPNALEAKTYVIPENGALQLIIDATNNPDKPFFLILDEMNLSHVERYFADFLSAMESKESIFLHSGPGDYNDIPPSLKLPDNLFIIGTVNIDETTYMFSPKVLDRANVIEFRVDEKEMKNFMAGNTVIDFEQLEQKGVSMAGDFLAKTRTKYQSSQLGQEIADDLLIFFNELKQVGAEFGYRTASEILRFAEVVKQLNRSWTKEQILDAAVMQKLLPKLHGSRRKLEGPLKALAELCFTLEHKSLASDALNPNKAIDFTIEKIKLPISLEKIRRMIINLLNNNFTSYAEA